MPLSTPGTTRGGRPFKPLPQKSGSDHASGRPFTNNAVDFRLKVAWGPWYVPQGAKDCTIKHRCKPVEAEALWDGVNRNGRYGFNAPIPGALKGWALIEKMLEISFWGKAMPANSVRDNLCFGHLVWGPKAP